MEIKYYRCGEGVIATCGTMDMEEITGDEYNSEIAAISEKLAIAEEAYERHRPMTESEVSRLLIAQQINTLAVDDNTALRMAEFYPEWVAGVSYSAGYKVQRNGKLWRCRQAHTSQEGWEPENVPALWEELCETHDGSRYDPIPYEGSMALVSGKYYSQDGVTYLCNRDTVNPVYNPLRELVGLYVEEVRTSLD